MLHRSAVLIALIVLGCAAPLHAQRRPQAGFKAGTSVFTISASGPTTTTFEEQDGTLITIVSSTDFSPRAGLAASVWVLYPIAGPFGIQGEASFITRAVSATTRSTFEAENAILEPLTTKSRFTFTYFEFPLMLAFEPQTRGRFRYRLTAGPHVALNQDAVSRARIGDGFGDAQSIGGIADQTYGMTAGVMATWEAGDFGSVAFGLQGSLDLSSLREAEPELRSRGLFAYVGFSF